MRQSYCFLIDFEAHLAKKMPFFAISTQKILPIEKSVVTLHRFFGDIKNLRSKT
jgi:hypothetical protein